MNRYIRPIRTGSIADLGFAIVVLVAYFTIFSNVRTISVNWLAIIIILGIIYIAVGIYGYANVSLSAYLPLRVSYFVVQLFLGMIILILGGATGFNAMILLPLAGQSVVLLPELWRYAINGSIAMTYALALRIITGSWETTIANLPVFLAGQVFILVFTQMALGEEKSRREVQQLAEELAEANQRLRESAGQMELLAVEKERNRMAREIHDGIGHHLTALNMQVKAARAILTVDPARSEDHLIKAEYLSQEALADVRQSISALRENQEEQGDLLDQIQAILTNAENVGLNVKLSTIGAIRALKPEAHLTFYRAVQESVSNTIKHAAANNFTVLVDYSQPQTMRMVIKDDGIGTDDPNGGFGLVGMRERVNLIDGSIMINTSKGKGFEIEIDIPE
jgi:signal transduction histidine kinase